MPIKLRITKGDHCRLFGLKISHRTRNGQFRNIRRTHEPFLVYFHRWLCEKSTLPVKMSIRSIETVIILIGHDEWVGEWCAKVDLLELLTNRKYSGHRPEVVGSFLKCHKKSDIYEVFGRISIVLKLTTWVDQSPVTCLVSETAY